MNPNDDAYVANQAACDAANAAAQAAYAAAQAANAAAQAAYDAAYAAAQAANAAAQPGNDDAYAATKAAYDAAYAAAQAACDAAYAAAQKKAEAVHVVSVTEATKQYFTAKKKANEAKKQAKKQANMRTLDLGDIPDSVVWDVTFDIYRVTCQAAENIYENKKRCLVALKDKEVMAAKAIYDAMFADAKTIYEHEMRRLRLMNEARKCIEDKQCSICLGCLDDDQTTKCTVCNHDIHTRCMRSWATTCSTKRRQLSCPLCRATWHAN